MRPMLVLTALLTACGAPSPSEGAGKPAGAGADIPAPPAVTQPEVAMAPLSLTSPAFAPGAEIPREYTCQGGDTSPELAWSGAPAGTRSFVLIEHDPDVPDPAAPQRQWVHWVLYDLPSDLTGLPKGAQVAPPGGRDGNSDWGKTGYGGPCPPIGRHRYFHTLYALDTVLGDRGPLTRDALEAGIAGHVLAKAELIGTYQKSP